MKLLDYEIEIEDMLVDTLAKKIDKHVLEELLKIK